MHHKFKVRLLVWSLGIWGPLSGPIIAAAPAEGEPSLEMQLLSKRNIPLSAAGVKSLLQGIFPAAEQSRDKAQLIQSLGADTYAVREAAMKQILALPFPPTELLKEATEGPDPEIRMRAKKLLDQMGEQGTEKDAFLFASLLLIRDHIAPGLAPELLAIAPGCQRSDLLPLAREAMRATITAQDKPRLLTTLEDPDQWRRAMACVGMHALGLTLDQDSQALLTQVTEESKIPAVLQQPRSDAKVQQAGWPDFFAAKMVQGEYEGQRVEFLDGVPQALLELLPIQTRTANTISSVDSRHGSAPWLYPTAGKNEAPRIWVSEGVRYYPILGTWRQHWGNSWITRDENGETSAEHVHGPHLQSSVKYLVLPSKE